MRTFPESILNNFIPKNILNKDNYQNSLASKLNIIFLIILITLLLRFLFNVYYITKLMFWGRLEIMCSPPESTSKFTIQSHPQGTVNIQSIKILLGQIPNIDFAIVFLGGSDGEESAYSAGELGLISGSERSPGEWNGNARWYSCLENFMYREACLAIVHGVIKNQPWLNDSHFHFPGDSVVKNLPANVGDMGLIPGLQRSPKIGNGSPLQYSCWVNPMDRWAWQVIVHGVAKESVMT